MWKFLTNIMLVMCCNTSSNGRSLQQQLSHSLWISAVLPFALGILESEDIQDTDRFLVHYTIAINITWCPARMLSVLEICSVLEILWFRNVSELWNFPNWLRNLPGQDIRVSKLVFYQVEWTFSSVYLAFVSVVPTSEGVPRKLPHPSSESSYNLVCLRTVFL